MSFIDSIEVGTMKHGWGEDDNALSGLRIAVVGGGPGGLAFAAAACNHGAEVTVFEKNYDPLQSDLYYSSKSFNLTLNDVGRAVVADSRVWKGGTEVEGRAVHDYQTGATRYASYGTGPEDHLTSIPRPLLQRNLAEIASAAGAELVFEAFVSNIDPDEAKVDYSDNSYWPNSHQADLLVVADGLHSIGDRYLWAMPDGETNMRPEKLNYVTATLNAKSGHGLSLNHLHYWHGPKENSYTIGVPNLDGSVSILFISDFADIERDQHPFSEPSKAYERLGNDFPGILDLDETLPEQLPNRARGRFNYKSVTNFVIGKAGVLVGDAGRAAPPWAGFGANTALYGAHSLVDLLVELDGDVEAALPIYEEHHQYLSEHMLAYVDAHGEFLSGRVNQHPEERASPALAGLIRTACKSAIEMPTLYRLGHGMSHMTTPRV